jgi:hypothetical protein
VKDAVDAGESEHEHGDKEKLYMDLNTFTSLHSQHADSLLPVYHIYRDLCIKQQLRDIRVVDGSAAYSFASYVIEGVAKTTLRTRTVVPLSQDSHINVVW